MALFAVRPEILTPFDIPGTLEGVTELKRGHINKTFVGVWRIGGVSKRYVHQVVNRAVFRDIDGLMGNIKRVTEHLSAEIAAGSGRSGDTTLTVIPTRTGALWAVDPDGECWRTFDYVEDTATHEVCTDPHLALEAAAILGRFHRSMARIGGPPLCFTIPHFHDGRHRLVALEDAVASDPQKRCSGAAAELEFAQSRQALGGLLPNAMESGDIPVRVAHSDMKLNNVLFREPGNRAVCLVDLDTCMPGSPLFDFGDLVRNTAVPCREDEEDLDRVIFDPALYEAICSGWLGEMEGLLNDNERKLLPLAPRSLAYILGVRFLTDHLNGDTYFRIQHPGHNLQRARTQFAVVRVMEQAEQSMKV